MKKECVFSKIVKDHEFHIGDELVLYVRKRVGDNRKDIKFVEIQKDTNSIHAPSSQQNEPLSIDTGKTLLLSETDFLKVASKTRYQATVAGLQPTLLVPGMHHVLLKVILEDADA